MLDTITRKRIDDARDILVGKVPDPKSQVEQITIALIYKFMDDMDRETEELGGERTFFKGEFGKYRWGKVFDPGLGGHELLDLYSEAIMKLNQNPDIPQLFRDIFKNAYLPYRDPETLKSFLKIIHDFSYDHSERLGDAFEYLLSVLGSQGSAGQFRTPRHIIDFMTAIVDPGKGETILDPACGTAGFLISSYKHILKKNSFNYDPENDRHTFDSADREMKEITLNSRKYKGDKITPDERNRLINNIRGYDISPDMVRLSLVNMYLHGFTDPHIYEYDTLTYEDRWNEFADVILANPPFMSPKGGIRPHKRFTINSSRSEVLFVDYMIEHLTSNGRAAIIVPEGIIFQSGTAYKQLRKMMVEEYLAGVISLPAGVFNPYSGVKTSILWIDREIARKTDKILFVKIENDGFDLGAQRKPIKQNDLPEAYKGILKYCKTLQSSESFEIEKWNNFLLVERSKIGENGEYNLSGERYKSIETYISSFPIKKLGEVTEIISGQSPPGRFYNKNNNGAPFYQGKSEFGDIFLGKPSKWTTHITKEAIKDDVLMSVRAPVGPVNIATQNICIGRGLAAIRAKNNLCSKFLFYILRFKEESIKGGGGSVFDSISRKQIEEIQIPLPPLSIQEEIVEEIEGYRKIIDGARMVVDNYKPHIDIDRDWPTNNIEELTITVTKGSSPNWQGIKYVNKDDGILFITSENVQKGFLSLDNPKYVEKKFNEIEKRSILKKGDVITNIVGASIGRTALFNLNVKANINQAVCIMRPDPNKLLSEYLMLLLNTDIILKKIMISRVENARANINMGTLKKIKIPVPKLSIQREIIGKINSELDLVKGSKKLIEIYEQKIKDRIGKVWGEDIPSDR